MHFMVPLKSSAPGQARCQAKNMKVRSHALCAGRLNWIVVPMVSSELGQAAVDHEFRAGGV